MSSENERATALHPLDTRTHALSDWAPWIVLSALLVLGVAGGFGFVPVSIARTPKADVAPASVPQPAPGGAQVAARPSGAASAEANGADVVTVRHILVQPKGAWKAEKDVTLTDAQAKERAEAARRRLIAGEDFVNVLREYSNSHEIVSEGGVMPKLHRGDGMPGIGTAAFSLKVGGVSEVVQTPFGFHVLQRT